MNGDSVKWINMQDSFFHKVLKKEEKALPRLSLLTKNDKIGYLYHGPTIPRIDYHDALFDASRSMIRFKKPHRLIKMMHSQSG